jgi:ribonuclease III
MPEGKTSQDLLASLEAAIGVTFTKRSLLLDALTHRSYVYEHAAPDVVSNERLEFLGDAVLSIIASDLLYRRFPKASEGELTNLRASLVRASTLAALARDLSLGVYLRLGRGEEITGGRTRELLLARAMEALIGAVYLDGGIQVTRAFLEPHLRAELASVKSSRQLKDDKSLLQEAAQAQLGVTPHYHLVSHSGPSHDRTFVVEVQLGERVVGRGEGSSKRQAEQASARAALADGGWENDEFLLRAKKQLTGHAE